MARIRNIKPDFFLDAELTDLSPLHRLLFVALWCHADREGRLEDKPRELKVRCLPFDDCNVDELLEELDAAEFIHRYEALGRRYIQIRGFTEHQRFHKDEKAVGFPNPPERVTRRGATRTEVTLSEHKVPSPTPEVAPPEPCLVSEIGNRKSEVGKLKTESPPTTPPEMAFFAWAQEERSRHRPGLLPEYPNERFAEFYLDAMVHLGGDEERLREAWRSWLRDGFAASRRPPYAMRVFQDRECWVKHVPEKVPKREPPKPQRKLEFTAEEVPF